MRYSEQAELAAYHMIDRGSYGFWLAVKAGQREKDDVTHFGDGSHISEVASSIPAASTIKNPSLAITVGFFFFWP